MTIKKKLNLIITSTSVLVVIIACTAFLVDSVKKRKEILKDDLLRIAVLQSKMNETAILFELSNLSEENLHFLRFYSDIEFACIYNEKNEPFSVYHRKDVSLPLQDVLYKKKLVHTESGKNHIDYFPKPTQENDIQETAEGKLRISHLISFNREIFGTIVIQNDMSSITNYIKARLRTLVIVVIISTILTGLMSNWLQRIISDPINRLAQTATQITNRKDYTKRATKITEDEVGTLIDTFNNMLEGIEQRDRSLVEAQLRSQKLNEILEATNDQIEEKNAELEQFTYTVSHDLKSPLLTIKGFSGLLKKTLSDTNEVEGLSHTTRIYSAADKMGLLLDGVLELSRIGRVVNVKSVIKTSQLINEVIESLEALIIQYNVKFHIQNNIPDMYGDKIRMSQVFQNLIENGIKYSKDHPTPTITIGSKNKVQHPVYFIQDNGIGIDPKYKSKVFDLFDQLDPTIDGTGIGLALVKRIVEVHHGRIWIETNKDLEGTTFCFNLNLEVGAPS